MKTFATVIISIAFVISAGAQSKYEKAMKGAIEKLNNSATLVDFQDAANTFERIGNSEKEEWLPQYYAAYSYIVMSFTVPEAGQKDAFSDKAQQFLDNAFQLAPEESELFALQAFLYPAKIMVDPMNRGMMYIESLNSAIDKSIALNPENPRPYYLRAVTIMNMPPEFGGGAEAAKPLFEKAKEKFDSFHPATPVSPNWGKEQNEQEMSKL